MNELSKMLRALRDSPHDAELTQHILTQAIIQILQSQRILGEILLQVPRRTVENQSTMLGLFWDDNQIELRVVPEKITQLRSDELIILLEHEALHLLWQHPLRYANSSTPELVQLATDVAVNQYLAEEPRETMTLQHLQQILRRKILPYQDSGVYLHLLQKLSPEERQKLDKFINGENETSKQGRKKLATMQETHRGWQLTDQQLAASNQQLRIAQIKKILHQAWVNTPKKDRGLLPGDVIEELGNSRSRANFNWERIIDYQLGVISVGHEEAPYRFNRRQPWRMELPGMVSRLKPKLLVFVDNSGSVTDEELERALSELSFLVNREKLPLEIYPFDAKVHVKDRQRVVNGGRVKFHRVGGGGTNFQCIFDFLHSRHVNPATSLIVIMTDGWGEEYVNSYNFSRVDWLLSGSPADLSVQSPVGHVFSLKKGIK